MFIRLCASFYRALLLAYPRDFRRDQGEAAARLFAEACEETWRVHGAISLARRLTRALVDVPVHGVTERRRARRDDTPRRGMDIHATHLVFDVRHALRALWRRPALSLSVAATLALGIGANTAMFSVIDATLLRPLPYRDADRVVYLREGAGAPTPARDASVARLLKWAADVASFERVEALRSRSVIVTGGMHTMRARLVETTRGLLDASRTTVVAGRLLDAQDTRVDAPRVVLLSDRLWRTHFGTDPSIIGRTIVIDDASHVVVGIADRLESDIPGLRYDIAAPLTLHGAAAESASARGVAWLRPGVTLTAATEELRALSTMTGPDGVSRWGVIEPPSNIFWQSSEFRTGQLALMAAACVLLMIACVNAANLLLAAGSRRGQELAVRSALGAGRGRIVRLLVVESVVLALAGGAGGLVLSTVGIRAVTALSPGPQLTSRLETIQLDALAFTYAAIITLLCGVIVGITAALRITAMAPAQALQTSQARGTTGLTRVQRTFVVADVALSFVLLVASGLCARAFLDMRFRDPGFAADRVLRTRIALPATLYPTVERQAAYFDALVPELARTPGITSVALGYGASPPSDFVATGTLQIDGHDTHDADFRASLSFVSPGHFTLMGIPLRAGREFTSADLRTIAPPGDTPVVVSQSFARQFWPDGSPVDEAFTITDTRGGRRYRIVGVAGDVAGFDLLTVDCDECRWKWHIYRPLVPQRMYTEVLMRLEADAAPPLADLRATIRRVDPQVPLDDPVQTAAEGLYTFINRPRFTAVLFSVFGGVSLVLAVVGIVSVVAYTVGGRTREIGIRLALGGHPGHVRRLIVSEGLRPVLIGLLAGGAAAVAMSRLMSNVLYGVSPTDPVTYTAVVLTLAVPAFLATWIPVWRATRANNLATLNRE